MADNTLALWAPFLFDLKGKVVVGDYRRRSRYYHHRCRVGRAQRFAVGHGAFRARVARRRV